MKSHAEEVFRTKSDITKAVTLEFEKKQNELLQEVKDSVTVQAISACMIVLDKEYGFKQIRQERFASAVKSLCKIMQNGIAGTELTTVDCMAYVKDKFGIDVWEIVGED